MSFGNKIYLGKSEELGHIYLRWHKWDCNLYWSFGYLGNDDCHYHFKSYLDGKHWKVEQVFKSTWITQELWWVMLDLFKQAYALKNAAEIYRHGGYITSKPGITDLLADPVKAAGLNADLKILLDKIKEVVIEEKLKLSQAGE
jgi:hypothetical protein